MAARPSRAPQSRRRTRARAGAPQSGQASRELRAWVKRFLSSYLPQHRGASVHTISSYGQALRRFLTFLTGRRSRRRGPTCRDLTAENTLAFLANLEKRRGNCPSTRNARLAAIMSFARFVFLMGGVDQSTYERLRHIAFKRWPARAVSHLEPVELDAIFRAVDHRTRDGFRDLLILKLLYNTGARASEIASLRISDLALDDLQATVTGKGRRRRTCGLWETTTALLGIYLASERRRPPRGFEDQLFINQRRAPLTRFGIWDIVRRYARRAAESCRSLTQKNITPHVFRHTTGVHLLEAGVDINTVRDWLGHEHIATTEIYARATIRKKQTALAKLQELDRKLYAEIAGDRSAAKIDPGIRRWLDSLKG